MHSSDIIFEKHFLNGCKVCNQMHPKTITSNNYNLILKKIPNAQNLIDSDGVDFKLS